MQSNCPKAWQKKGPRRRGEAKDVGERRERRAYVMPQKTLVLVSGHVVRPVPVVGELKSHVNWAYPGAAHRSTSQSC
jgi:hypothetical protein